MLVSATTLKGWLITEARLSYSGIKLSYSGIRLS